MEKRFNEATERLAELEQAFCNYRQEANGRLDTFQANYITLVTAIDEITAKYNAAIERFNAAVETFNLLAERVTALEKNYDPTVIE